MPKEEKPKKEKKGHGEASAEVEVVVVKSKPVKEKASKHADEAGEAIKKGKH